MSHLNLENDFLSFENQTWENYISNNFESDKSDNSTRILDVGEDIETHGHGSARKGKGKIENVEKNENGEASDHGLHIWTERERRKKMRTMFSSLHSLLPQLPPKADKTAIVDEAICYIKKLQSTLQRLQKQKLDRFHAGPSNQLTYRPISRLANVSSRETFMADQVSTIDRNNNNNNNNNNSSTQLPVIISTWTSSNVVLNICGNDAQFVVYAPKKLGLFTAFCCALEKQRLEVVSAHISSDIDRCTHMLQARVGKGAGDHYPELMSVEEAYKQAAVEMMYLVSS